MDNLTILVTGGTGSFGRTFVKRVLENYNPEKIIIFSRDEDKQHAMRLEFNNPKLVFEIGDVRDKDRVRLLFRTYTPDLIFHAAALKQAPAGEFFPLEVVKTNIFGSANVAEAATEFHAKKMVGLSTDKAAYPINAMGMSKALMEKVLLSFARQNTDTYFCVTRYGNVMCSRGSIIPIWIKAAKDGSPITVTAPSMTRFLLSLTDAIDLVIYALMNGNNGDTLAKEAPSCTMQTLAEAVKELFNSSSEIIHIGVRHGEKMHETLVTSEEMLKVIKHPGYYVVPLDSRGLDYQRYFSQGDNKEVPLSYSSDKTTVLTKEEVKNILLQLEEVQNELRNT